jgi:hypothetical protein
MKPHKLLAEKDRHSRCSAMDALEILRREAGFEDDDCAVAHVGCLRLPSRDKVGLVDVKFNSPAR